ncbi:N,N-dimethylformamidase beta subunit family domain-containing protein [Peribacillus sp. SCS-37]|uniref:N,N-dimethylformamidase beta subunit family domain-containing protein n=1 Tax=Paraperibacillus esterisolvens TaxID=3115296 RepID=UPI003905A3F7
MRKLFSFLILLISFLALHSRAEAHSGGWEITKPAGRALQGYTNAQSYEKGQAITFYIHNDKPYHIDFYRMGYNSGKGAAYLGSMNQSYGVSANKQPQGEVGSAGWKPSAYYKVPLSWKSGVYIAKLTDTGMRQSHITFVVRDHAPKAQLGVMIATNTYQAYNAWGGKSLYNFNSSDGEKAGTVSFNRPSFEAGGAGQFFRSEYQFIRWIERQNYSVTYFSDRDVHNGLLAKSSIKALVIPGHNEYWTRNMWTNIEKFGRTRGIALLSANTGYREVSYRKDAPYLMDMNGEFRSSTIQLPENKIFGAMFNGAPAERYNDLPIVSDHPLLKGTGLKKGSVIPKIVGGEVDGISGHGFAAPKGVEVIGEKLMAFKGTSELRNSNLLWFKKPEGGRVFAVGTFYWNWQLDSYGKESEVKTHSGVQALTRNALDALIK